VVLYTMLAGLVIGVGAFAQATGLRTAGLVFSNLIAVLLAVALSAQLLHRRA